MATRKPPKGKRPPATSAPKKPAQSDSALASNSLARLLGLLDLFTPAAPAWPIDALIHSNGMSRSTGYRYVKALNDAGLLSAVSNGYYILGPRILELDRQIRQCDPLYIAGGPVMKQLVAQTGHSALLCALYRNSVLCVREELTADRPPNLFNRGQRRTLFQGAASKIILPYLRPHQLRVLYDNNEKAVAASGLGADWASFRAALVKMRRQGYVMTIGEFNPGVIGFSAPIFNRAQQILGSIGVTGAEEDFTHAQLKRIAELTMSAAKQITERIAVVSVGMDRAPRGVGSSNG